MKRRGANGGGVKIYRAEAVVVSSKLRVPVSNEAARQLTDEGQQKLWKRLLLQLEANAPANDARGQALDATA